MKIKVGTIIYLAIAVLLVIYGITIMSLQSGSKFFILWFITGGIFALAGFVHNSGIFAGFHKGLRITINILVIAGVLWLLVTQLLVVSAFFSKPSKGLDYILVLGSQVTESGPAPITKLRLDTAYDYLSENEDTRVIVSGGMAGSESKSEGEVMKDYLVGRGIAPDRILTEEESRNTTENIRLSSNYFDKEEDTIGIVTNNFHLFRAKAIAKKQGLKNVSGIAAPCPPYYLPNNMFRESFGITKDFLFGNL
ncbi:MAG: YdcF family protein [Lachnospiraceae bacterium]|nr:YdcF family protein [Lachnospiraceae bacterium]